MVPFILDGMRNGAPRISAKCKSTCFYSFKKYLSDHPRGIF